MAAGANPHLITVVTANLAAVGAPTPIAFIHGDATVVPPLGTTGMAIEHETVGLHRKRCSDATFYEHW
jgi:hypothetical protein